MKKKKVTYKEKGLKRTDNVVGSNSRPIACRDVESVSIKKPKKGYLVFTSKKSVTLKKHNL